MVEVEIENIQTVKRGALASQRPQPGNEVSTLSDNVYRIQTHALSASPNLPDR
jgi:hypothetical protein